MNDRLKAAIEALEAAASDPDLSPMARGNAREDALVQGLHGLAEEFGRKIGFTRIDGNGEMDFNIVGPEGAGEGRPCGNFGEELAELLSAVPHRTGVMPVLAAVMPENGWCRINHFDVERLLLHAAEKLSATEAPRPS